MKTITAEELQAKMAVSQDLMVINVLRRETFEDCHIAGSINIPINALEKHIQNWDKNTEIIVYCAHNQCSTSTRAYNMLSELGFTNVSEYRGGIKEWKQKGLPTEGPCAAEYLK